MKKIALIISIILICLLISACADEVTEPPVVEIEDIQEETNTEIPDVTVVDTEENNLPEKPTTPLEIIALADSMNVDTSLTDFTLDGILDSVQLKETDDAGDEYQNSTAYLGDSVSLGLGVFGNHPKELVIAKG